MSDMILLLLLLLAEGVTSSAIEKRLVSARTCPDTERLHHVRVLYEHGGTSSTCGGTLIHKDWVITASHCYGGVEGTLKVEIAGHPSKSEKKILQIKGAKIIKYTGTEPIMLLKLPESIKSIVPAELPVGVCIPPSDGEKLQVSGRGAITADGGPGVKDLMCLDVKTLSKSHCPDLTETEFKDHKYIYCGGGVDSAEIKACKGDSGSGLLKKENVKKRKNIFLTKQVMVEVLYGVLISGKDPCEDKFVFVDICAKPVKKWLDSLVK